MKTQFTHPMPNVAKYADKEIVVWDYQIHHSNKNDGGGVYICYLNLHQQNSLVYVGHSESCLQQRVYQHCLMGSVVSQHYQILLKSNFEKCANSDCDCLPRNVFRLFYFEDAISTEIEEEFIKFFKPPLNIRGIEKKRERVWQP